VFYSGVFYLPWWSYALIALGLTHVTIIAVTIYLHRHQTHRALDLHPVVSHFFRFWRLCDSSRPWAPRLPERLIVVRGRIPWPNAGSAAADASGPSSSLSSASAISSH
jgi:hypothetical protein